VPFFVAKPDENLDPRSSDDTNKKSGIQAM